MQAEPAANASCVTTGTRAEAVPDGAVGSANADARNIKISSKTERNMDRQTAWQLKKFKRQTINAAPRLPECQKLAVDPMQHWFRDRPNSNAKGQTEPVQRLFAIKKGANYVGRTGAHSIFSLDFAFQAVCWRAGTVQIKNCLAAFTQPGKPGFCKTNCRGVV